MPQQRLLFYRKPREKQAKMYLIQQAYIFIQDNDI